MLKLYRQSSRGFTLVEVIIVIAILGVVGGLAAMIIGKTIEAYDDVTRREQLQASVRLAVERMAREIRHALPNSICVHDGGGCVSSAQNRFYFIPVKDSGRYQDRPGVYTAPPPIHRDRIRLSPQSHNLVDVLSTNAANRLTISANDWIAIYNSNNSDVYLGINDVRHQVTAVAQKDIHNDADPATDIDQIQFTANVGFAEHSPTRRFHIIDNTNQATLFYVSGNELRRSRTTFASPNTPSGYDHLLLENVQACNFTYNAGSQSRAALLRIDVTVASRGETIQVIHDAHVYNVQ